MRGLQEALNERGYDCGEADGAYGGKTESAVNAYALTLGIEAEGVAWPGIRKSLMKKPASESGGGLIVTGTIRNKQKSYTAGDVVEADLIVKNASGRTLTNVDCWEWIMDGARKDIPLKGQPPRAALPSPDMTWGFELENGASQAFTFEAVVDENCEADGVFAPYLYAWGYDADSGETVYSNLWSGDVYSAGFYPELTLTGAVRGEEAAYAPGDEIVVDMRIKNTGNSTFVNLREEHEDGVTDGKGGWTVLVSGADVWGMDLAPGEEFEFEYHQTVDERFEGLDSFETSVVVYSAGDPDGESQEDGIGSNVWTHEFALEEFVRSELLLTGEVQNGSILYGPNDTVTAVMTVTNAGRETLVNLREEHWDTGSEGAKGEAVPEINGGEWGMSLAPGESFDFVYRIALDDSYLEIGSVDTAVVVYSAGDSGVGNPGDGMTSNYWTYEFDVSEGGDLRTGLTLSGTVRGEKTLYRLGDEIVIDMTVENTGETAFPNLWVKCQDEMTEGGSGWTVPAVNDGQWGMSLAAGESFDFEYHIVFDDSFKGIDLFEADVAVCAAEDEASEDGFFSNHWTHAFELTDGLETAAPTPEALAEGLTVTTVAASRPANGERYMSGESVEYTIEIVNEGEQAVKNIMATVCPEGRSPVDIAYIEVMNPGETRTISWLLKITEEEGAKGTLNNLAKAVGTDGENNAVEAQSDSAAVQTGSQPSE